MFAAVLGGVLVFGLYNQITYVHVPPYELASSFADDRRFVTEIDRRLPEGAAVFQLPHLPFPEGGQQAGLFENDLLRGYLHSDDLRWSFGATKGRPEEWVDDLAGLPPSTVLDAAAAAGFAGLYVDRYGYQDGGRALESEARGKVGAEPLASGSGRLSFFDLREYGRRLEAAHSPEELRRLPAGGAAAVRLRGERVPAAGTIPCQRSLVCLGGRSECRAAHRQSVEDDENRPVRGSARSGRRPSGRGRRHLPRRRADPLPDALAAPATADAAAGRDRPQVLDRCARGPRERPEQTSARTTSGWPGCESLDSAFGPFLPG